MGERVKGRILALDDDGEIQAFLRRILLAEGHQLVTVSRPQEAIAELKKSGHFDLILSDIQLPEMSGLEFVGYITRNIDSIPPIVMMSAYGSVENTIQAIRLGVSDFLIKPFRIPELKLAVEKNLSGHNDHEMADLRESNRVSRPAGNIIGKSAKMQAVFDLIKHVSRTNVNVLINGETGTGKELVARAIHDSSPRRTKPFVAINCSAIPEALLESELFGHTRGSFTGAHENRRGLFTEADGGTLFLDEIGDMDVALQAKLLRVIQERKVKPVGDNRYREIDVRIIAATHKDLRKAIRESKFREDLFYRLSVIPISIPPLRDRVEDIPLLVDHFLRKYGQLHGTPVRGITKDALALLEQDRWDGNVRELENVMERAVVLTNKEMIVREDFLTCMADRKRVNPVTGAETTPRTGYPSLREVEKQYIRFILHKMGGKKEKAAQVLGIDRKTLYRKKLEDEGVGDNRADIENHSPQLTGEFFSNVLETSSGPAS